MTELPPPSEGEDDYRLTRDRRRRLLRMLDDHEKSRHFWRTIGIWFKWFGIALAAMVAIKTLVVDLLKGLLK